MASHEPVLLEEVLYFLDPLPGKVIIDATIGAGGHAEEILKRLQPGGKLIGIDRDSESLRIAHERLKFFENSFMLVSKNFRFIKDIIIELGIGEVDGILFDMGISSIQMETGERGFSIKNIGPLDMRMDRNQSLTAKELVNKLSESELSGLIKSCGEERFHKRIARNIVFARKRKEIATTQELTEVVCRSLPHGLKRQRIHPATRTFQALRIRVNDELGGIEEALRQSPDILKKNGRMCVISFHSLEDRIAKNSLKDFKAKGIFKVLTKKPVTAKEEELSRNPRSRSAKLRAAEKLI
ncbi:MAG: 16S rRNA (cytosine(1402)-N(4))-methyltransferase RsmH [Candidatus Omnitrophica bacterium]|nr:16S rRNA (cytosine(1402)-N(4))-methyltransferase RsmH [Candidatus Omnitrophota bacterium]